MVRRRRRFTGGAGYVANAVDFDGTNDLIRIIGAMTGFTDSKKATFSIWFKTNVDANTGYFFFGFSTSTFQTNCLISATNKLSIQFANVAGTIIYRSFTATALTAASGWHNWLFSVDLAVADSARSYVDDVADIVPDTFTDDTIDHTPTTSNTIGANHSGLNKFNGCLSEFYYNAGVYIDFDIEANRRFFVSADNKPVSLGITGELPTGSEPQYYLNGDATNFQTDQTSNNNDFTVTGSLDNCPTGPSD